MKKEINPKCILCNDTGTTIKEVYDFSSSRGHSGLPSICDCQDTEKDITKESKVIDAPLVTEMRNLKKYNG